jgi:hypothetical protein
MRNYNRKLSGPPQTISDHIDQALARVPGLGGRQKTALKAGLGRMMRDIHFLRQLTEQAHATGPWSSQAAGHLDSQGNLISG